MLLDFTFVAVSFLAALLVPVIPTSVIQQWKQLSVFHRVHLLDM